jgi:hypothetical protein
MGMDFLVAACPLEVLRQTFCCAVGKAPVCPFNFLETPSQPCQPLCRIDVLASALA